MMQRASSPPSASLSGDAKSSVSCCPGDETLFSLALGELGEAARSDAEEHVRGCADCREILSEVLRSLGEDDTPDDDQAEAAGVRLDRYELQELIGSGGAGVVYRAFDPALEREVAVKILRPDLPGAQGEFQARLRREAKATAQLSHPNVVTAYDVGATDSGGFIVLEYFSGGTLEEWLNSEHTLEERLRVMREAGRGLAAAHEKNVVHRDFKPQNVLLSADGRVCVTDFGLARLEDTGQSGFRLDSTIGDATITRGLMGTPNYMAPEVLTGNRGDELSDQFSFSVALYQAVNGRHPFRGAAHVTLAELLTRMQGGLIDPGIIGVPEHVRKVIKRGLSADPAARFPSVTALLAALENKPRRWNAKLLIGTAVLVTLVGLVVFLASTGSAPKAEAVKFSPKLAAQKPPPPAPSSELSVAAKTAPETVTPKNPTTGSSSATNIPETGGPHASLKDSPDPTSAPPRPVALPPRVKSPPRKSVSRTKAKKAAPPKTDEPRFNDRLRDPF